jgi:hypothetical protein
MPELLPDRLARGWQAPADDLASCIETQCVLQPPLLLLLWSGHSYPPIAAAAGELLPAFSSCHTVLFNALLLL